MNSSNKTGKSLIITIIGLIIMVLLTLTKVVPSTKIAGYSVFVGIIFFFIVEYMDKKPDSISGLRFSTFIADIKKPGVLIWTLLPIVSCILTILVGHHIFNNSFNTHVLNRTDSMLSFNKVPLLILQIIITALGEEIAFRGFFLGKSMKIVPFWLAAIVSSVLFASGHIAVGAFGLVFFDILTILIDSLIYSMIYKKSGNCLISAVSHILCNLTGIAFSFLFFL